VTQSETHNKPTCKCVRVMILSNSSVDWLSDTLTGVGGASHHAP